MDSMASAIRNRRGGQGLLEEDVVSEETSEAAQSGGMDGTKELKGLVSSLDENQKSMLLQMLVKDQASNDNAPNIEKGAAGPGEQMEVEEFVSDMEPEEGHESEDEIAESMISSADKSRAEQGVKPRNLGERVKVGLANKLKGKRV